jgi:uncharacterized protein
VAGLAGALALAGCGGNTSSGGDTDAGGDIACTIGQDKRIGIATGNATGVYFTLGNAFAEKLPDSTGGKLRATAAETGASVENIEQLVDDKYQVAFSLADTAADAVAGEDPFGSAQPVRALARIHTNYTQVVVRKGADIDSVGDLRGKRVSTGAPKSGTEVIAQRVLRAAGLDPEADVKAQRLDLTKTVDGMKDGTLDAMFFSGGLPTPGITDLFATEGDDVELLDISPVLGRMRETSTAYLGGAIPKGTYGAPADVPTIVVPNLLLVREDADPDLACVLTKALFEHRDDLVKVNASAADIRLETSRDTGSVPLHRGAVRALDDLGAPPAGTPVTPAPSPSPSPSASASPGASPSEEPSGTPTPSASSS